MFQNNKCPICGSPSVDILYKNSNDPISSDKFNIFECKDCLGGFVSPFPANLDPYYPRQYRQYGPIVLSILNAFYSARVRRWIKNKPTKSRVLEIGCGAGIMLSAFKRYGWEVKGIERNQDMANQARTLFDIEVFSCNLDDLPEDDKYDLIILFNVLEHLSNPQKIIKECSKRLKINGEIIISVPNFLSWQSLFGGPVWLHLDPPRHLIHFSLRSLIKILAMNQLICQSVSFKSWEHDPYGWTETTINKIMTDQNIVTRYLMGLDTFRTRTFFAFLALMILIIPAIILSIISWVFGRGALMEVWATKINEISS